MPIDISDEELYPLLDDGEAYQLVLFLANLASRLESHYLAQIRRHCLGDGPHSLEDYLGSKEHEIPY
jgi:hypothetical protein